MKALDRVTLIRPVRAGSCIVCGDGVGVDAIWVDGVYVGNFRDAAITMAVVAKGSWEKAVWETERKPK